MLSLPLVIPRDEHTIWYNPTHRPYPPPNLETPSHDQSNNPAQQQSAYRRQIPNPRSTLALLQADENTIEQRKQNVRRFGAGWIRPPGIPKTYQATMDEIQEREEQEILARREQAMMELANAAEAEALRQAEMEGEDGEAEERDLDDDIPEAEDDLEDGEDEEDGDEGRDLDDDIPEADDLTFNEESFIDGNTSLVDHHLEMDEVDMESVLQEEHDLDDDVPEAGSYQHTDTDIEDDSSELEEEDDSEEGQEQRIIDPPRRFISRSPVHSRFAHEEGLSSLLSGSSFLGSSPVGGRSQPRPRPMGPRRLPGH